MTSWIATQSLRCSAAKLSYIGENSSRKGVLVSRNPGFVLPSGFLAEVSLIAEVGYFPDSYSDDILFFRAIRRVTHLTTCESAKVLYRIHPQAESSRNAKAWWAFNQLLPLYEAGTLSLDEINSMVRSFINTGFAPEEIKSRLSNPNSVETRLLARSAYACWLNHDYTGVATYALRLLAYVPELGGIVKGKWGRNKQIRRSV
jgi:hypothetical protein